MPSPSAATSNCKFGGFDCKTYTLPFKRPGSNGVEISSVPTFEAAGHDGGPSIVSFSASGPPMFPSQGWHATNPVACPGLIATPSGNTTVVSFKPGVANPSGFSPCGTFTIADRPAGVSEKLVSGARLIKGWKCLSFSQPVITTGTFSLLCHGTLVGGAFRLSSPHVPNSSRLNCGCPPHDVGSVNNGFKPTIFSRALRFSSPKAVCSPGVPQIVVVLNTILRCGMFACIVIP